MIKITALFLLFLAQEAVARSWRDISTYHDLSPRDKTRSVEFEEKPLEYTATPTQPPSHGTTSPPTRSPGVKPTAGDPTQNPTDSPTGTNRYPENPTPLRPPRGYFNYDVSETNPYGPGYPALVYGDDGLEVAYQNNGWAYAVKPNNYYWDEFGSNGFGPWNGALASRGMDRNECGNTGMQSPIDIRLSGVACVEHHQIRTRVSEAIRDACSQLW